jgi:hypothetical protein
MNPDILFQTHEIGVACGSAALVLAFYILIQVTINGSRFFRETFLTVTSDSESSIVDLRTMAEHLNTKPFRQFGISTYFHFTSYSFTVQQQK